MSLDKGEYNVIRTLNVPLLFSTTNTLCPDLRNTHAVASPVILAPMIVMRTETGAFRDEERWGIFWLLSKYCTYVVRSQWVGGVKVCQKRDETYIVLYC